MTHDNLIGLKIILKSNEIYKNHVERKGRFEILNFPYLKLSKGAGFHSHLKSFKSKFLSVHRSK